MDVCIGWHGLSMYYDTNDPMEILVQSTVNIGIRGEIEMIEHIFSILS